MGVPEVNPNNYYYELPKERIASFPLKKRSDSKLLVWENENARIRHSKFSDIADSLPDNSTLVLNESKVVAARLNMKKATGGKAELLCVDPIQPSEDPQITLSSSSPVVWRCIVGGKRIRTGAILKSVSEKAEDIGLKAIILKKEGSEADVEFDWNSPDKLFYEILNLAGAVPLPPYIKREPVSDDKERYQTVYAQREGSVAAPTAGLHFDEALIGEIKEKAKIAKVALHVGPGTFKPIDADTTAEHIMHSEKFSVRIEDLTSLRDSLENDDYIIAGGTTAIRTLETLYWIGAKVHSRKNSQGLLVLEQWEAYELDCYLNAKESFDALINYMEANNLGELKGVTSLFIVPGYDFKVVKGAITNFHLPKSSLILLVAALVGDSNWKKIYREAMEKDYRFLSYGDSSLLLT